MSPPITNFDDSIDFSFVLDPPEMDEFDCPNLEEILTQSWTPEAAVQPPPPSTAQLQQYLNVAPQQVFTPPDQNISAEEFFNITPEEFFNISPEEFFIVAPEQEFKPPTVNQEESSPSTYAPTELVTTGNYEYYYNQVEVAALPDYCYNHEVAQEEDNNNNNNRCYMRPMETLAAPPPLPAATPEHGRRPSKKISRWTTREHVLFLTGLRDYGNDWVRISKELVPTRSANQIASHAQKYFLRQQANNNLNAAHAHAHAHANANANANANTRKKRASIHDITIRHLPNNLSVFKSKL